MTQIDLFADVDAEIRARVADALTSPAITNVETAVLNLMLLNGAFGRKSIINIEGMQRRWSDQGMRVYDARAIKGAVKSLVENHRVPIGSSRTVGDSGYWLCTNDQDVEDACRPLKNEIYSMFRRIKALSPNSDFVRKLNGQLSLLSEEGGVLN